MNNQCGKLKVNLGCGKSKMEGWIGLDQGDYGQEIIRDMKNGLPFCDNSCVELFADQVLEHIQMNEDFIFIMNECLRVLKPGGIMTIRVPWYESEVAIKDPTHCRFFSRNTFTYMIKDNHWEYGFDKRWKILKNEQDGSQLDVILKADK